MGKYRSYAQRIDTLVRQRFLEYEKATEAYEKARKAKTETPMRTGWGVTPEYQIKAQKAEINFKEAEIEYKKAKEVYQNTLQEVKEIRDELYEEVSRNASVRPEDLDRNVVELLQSGICSDSELVGLYEKAGNATTKRYIAKFANDEYQKLADMKTANDQSPEGAKNRERREKLLSIVENSREYLDPERSEAVQIVDHITNQVLKRTINNPAMIRNWGELTEEALAEL